MREEIREAILHYSEGDKSFLEEVLFNSQGIFWYLSGYVPGATIKEIIEVMDEMRKEFLQNV